MPECIVNKLTKYYKSDNLVSKTRLKNLQLFINQIYTSERDEINYEGNKIRK